ncbi:MAG: energy-coupling factor transporter transmembrane component T family protein [Campylobacteraceae bacterium]
MVQENSIKKVTPLVAFLSLTLFSIVVALSPHIYISFFLPVIFVAIIYKNHLLLVLKKLFFLNTLVAIIAATLLWQNLYEMALLIFLRSNLILSFMLLLFCDKDEFSISIALQRLHLPKKLVTTVFFTVKSIFLIKQEFIHFQKTLHVRGFSPKTDLLSYKTLSGFVGILVIKAIERSIFLQKAMLLRGFNDEIYSLSSYEKITNIDKILLALTIFSLFCFIGVIV